MDEVGRPFVIARFLGALNEFISEAVLDLTKEVNLLAHVVIH